MKRRNVSRGRITIRKRLIAKRSRDIRILLQKFPIKQDRSILPPVPTELWDSTVEAPRLRRRA